MKNKTNTFDEIFGWYGTIAIVVAYFMVSMTPSFSDNIWFQIINLTGSLGILWISNKKKVYQSVVLNIIWSLIAIVAIVRMFF